MKITINTDGFNEWGGGVDFIKYLLLILSTKDDVFTDIIVPKDDFASLFRKNVFPIKNGIKSLGKGKFPRWVKKDGFDEGYYHNAFSGLVDKSKLTFINSNSNSYFDYHAKSDNDIIFPCMRVPTNSVFDSPWIGYIYDFQHCYYPSFFSVREIKKRELYFRGMLSSANNIIVNANSVIADAKNFIGDFSADLHALPFSPCPQQIWLDDNSNLVDKYAINKDYFIVCNQFWKHKNHAVVFKAFKEYIKVNPEAYLVCTGGIQDYRFPEYFGELKALIQKLGISSKIQILGHIPKLEQVELIKKSIAVIQPTLFEGGPGGGATYDAVALGKKVILSDIDVNREVNCGDVIFFNPQDEYSLAKALFKAEEEKSVKENGDLMKLGLKRREKCADFIMSVIRKEIESRN